MKLDKTVTTQRVKVLYVTTFSRNERTRLYFQKPQKGEGSVILKTVTTEFGGVTVSSTTAKFAGQVYTSPITPRDTGFGTDLGTVTIVLREEAPNWGIYLHTDIICKKGISLEHVHETAERVSTKPGRGSVM